MGLGVLGRCYDCWVRFGNVSFISSWYSLLAPFQVRRQWATGGGGGAWCLLLPPSESFPNDPISHLYPSVPLQGVHVSYVSLTVDFRPLSLIFPGLDRRRPSGLIWVWCAVPSYVHPGLTLFTRNYLDIHGASQTSWVSVNFLFLFRSWSVCLVPFSRDDQAVQVRHRRIGTCGLVSCIFRFISMLVPVLPYIPA